MTSDGISRKDWDTVKDFSARIANAVSASDDQETTRLTRKLLRYLARIEAEYGGLPSILATRADYTSGSPVRIRLLQQAWRAAKRMGDKANLVFISSSLAELFIEELHRVEAGQRWLSLLEESLEGYWDDHEYNELRRLRQRLKMLARRKRQR